jgi:serine/threonine protein kinase
MRPWRRVFTREPCPPTYLPHHLPPLRPPSVVHTTHPQVLLSSPEEGAGVIKLADMGFAKPLSTAATAGGSTSTSAVGLTTSCGTPSYVAPEILRGERYGRAVDLWSLGVITYILLCGYAPFSSPSGNQTELFRAIVSGKYFFDAPYWDGVSEPARDLIRCLLVVDPAKRATAEAVLRHPWLHGSVSSGELSSALSQMRFFQTSRRRVLRAGVLVKQGHFVRNWKRRLFVLTADSLEYYEPGDAALLPPPGS